MPDYPHLSLLAQYAQAASFETEESAALTFHLLAPIMYSSAFTTQLGFHRAEQSGVLVIYAVALGSTPDYLAEQIEKTLTAAGGTLIEPNSFAVHAIIEKRMRLTRGKMGEQIISNTDSDDTEDDFLWATE